MLKVQFEHVQIAPDGSMHAYMYGSMHAYMHGSSMHAWIHTWIHVTCLHAVCMLPCPVFLGAGDLPGGAVLLPT